MQLTVLVKNFVQTWKTPLLVVVFLFFFGMVSKWAMDSYQTMYLAKETQDVANGQTRTNDVLVYLFYADWCKHCQNAKPAWDSFRHQYDQTSRNNRRIVCNPVDCTDVTNEDTRQLLKQFRVNSYPTILMVKDQRIIKFDASVTKENLDEFIQKMI